MKFVCLPGLDGTGLLFHTLQETCPPDHSLQIISYPHDRFLGYDALEEYVWPLLPKDEPFVLLAESFGGPLAVRLAAAHPPHLQALVLSATFVACPVPLIWRWVGWALSPIVFYLQPPDAVLRWFLWEKKPQGGEHEQFVNVLNHIPKPVLSKRLREVFRTDYSALLQRCDIPMIYIEGAYDFIVWKRNVKQMLRLAPHLQHVQLPVTHFVFQMKPRDCWQAIQQFLSKLNPGRNQLGSRGL